MVKVINVLFSPCFLMLTNVVEEADVVLLTIPSDLSSYKRRGQDLGALFLRDLVLEVSGSIKVLDYGTVFVSNPFDLREFHESVYKTVKKVREFGKPLLILGGDHGISYGCMRAFSECNIVVFDAHPDLVKEVGFVSHEGFLYHFRDRLVLKGVRAGSAQEFQTMKSIKQKNTRDTYVSIDVDVLDPSIMPGVAYPESNGWSFERLERELCELFDSRNVLCVDVTEFCPLIEKKKSVETVKKLLSLILLKLSYAPVV